MNKVFSKEEIIKMAIDIIEATILGDLALSMFDK
jgi:hypothetical protein